MVVLEAPLTHVLANVHNLTTHAVRLFKSNNFALATHVAILSCEESAKFLIVYCRAHLPESVFRKRFQHLNKHLVSRAPWFLSGQFSVVYTLHLAGKYAGSNEPVAKVLGPLSEYVSEYFFRTDPEAIARSILGVLESKNADVREQSRQADLLRERDRLSSVYVDISDELEVVAGPMDFDRDKAKSYLEQAVFCRAVINFITTPSETVSQFINALPAKDRREIKRDSEKTAREMVRHLVAGAIERTTSEP